MSNNEPEYEGIKLQDIPVTDDHDLIKMASFLIVNQTGQYLVDFETLAEVIKEHNK